MAVVGLRSEQQVVENGNTAGNTGSAAPSYHAPPTYDRSLLPNFFSAFDSVESACQSMDLNPLQEEVGTFHLGPQNVT